MREISSSITFEINVGETVPMRVSHSTRLKVQGGAVWVTRSNDTEDYWLEPGHTLPAAARRTALVECRRQSGGAAGVLGAVPLRRTGNQLAGPHGRTPDWLAAPRLAHRLIRRAGLFFPPATGRASAGPGGFR